ncbi:Retrovirus-related Pol polyprotein from transposon 297 [Araneus ventricosus]|uniref:RNA-directed DNA polymerase n=1 Tax=Araneus ventricosus TaxID=182803 RepID=A0A4Y2JHU3_ARAVE|nr:Retrovirus-related Pol polyprotein from transposon 297 [Araneus ventricosus]
MRQLNANLENSNTISTFGLDFLQNFNFMVDLEKNEIRTGGEEMPLFSASAEDSKLCSVLAKEKTIIAARSECLIHYPLARIDDTLDAFNGSQWFWTLDLKSGFWQVEIQPENKEKTAFTTGQGLWQFKVMPFGLCNAPATFERLMETVLRGLTSEACLVYLDDIIIVGRTFQEHLKNIRKVFQRLKKANLKLSPKKCRFFRKEVSYHGHIISADGVKTDPEKTKSVVDWPRPETVHDLRSFLGLSTYYCRFVRNFSAIARPLHKLIEARSNFNWTEECEKSFNSLKQALTLSTNLAPILATWRQIWRPWRQIDDSRKCKPFLDISIRGREPGFS